MELTFYRLFAVCIQLLYISKFSNAVTCYLSSSLTCTASGSCGVYSRLGSIGYICASNNCSTVLNSYPFSDGYVVNCCTTNNCNAYTKASQSIKCYDNTTSAASSQCSASGGCFIISNGTSTYRGCSEISCTDLQASYNSSLGYTASCCTTSLCNGSGSGSGSSSSRATLLPSLFLFCLLLVFFYIKKN